jgi:tRNA(Arg) A34 adenosine deaminase TadA
VSHKHFIIARTYDRRGRLIARAANSYKQTHPVQARYAALAGQPLRIYLHAEMACLLRSGDVPIYKMVIERYHADGRPALAKPCPICQLAIKDWGVKHVEYTE